MAFPIYLYQSTDLLICMKNDRYVYKFVQRISLYIFSSIPLMFEVSNLSVNSSFYQRILSFSFKQKIDRQKKYTFRRRKMYTS